MRGRSIRPRLLSEGRSIEKKVYGHDGMMAFWEQHSAASGLILGKREENEDTRYPLAFNRMNTKLQPRNYFAKGSLISISLPLSLQKSSRNPRTIDRTFIDAFEQRLCNRHVKTISTMELYVCALLNLNFG